MRALHRRLALSAAAVSLTLGAARAQTPAETPRAVPPLRVGAGPNHLPFSNAQGEGFEDKLAELAARDPGTTLSYVWRPQRRGFVRNTLNEGRCDLVMGVPTGYELTQTTRPYYRSTYVFVYRADRGNRVASLADGALRRLRIGIHGVGDANPPPMTALARFGIRDNVQGYTIYGDYSEPNPPARLIEAVAEGKIDVAIAWGPLAAYVAKRQDVPLTIVPVPGASDPTGQPWTYPIAMGLRRCSTVLATALDRVLAADPTEIRRILESFDVPLLPIDAPASSRRAAAGRVRP